MKNKLLVLLSGVMVVMLMASMSSVNEDVALSSGAPVGSTNAPGELTCGKAGCHTGNNGVNNINTGTGVLTITSAQDISHYTPGATYDITVALEEAGVERFGFSFTALDESNNKAGTLMVTDPIRNQVLQGAFQFIEREYMTYRMVGTNPYQQGKGMWTFKWKAPDHYVGKISFYAAGISANNDATDKGDLVYTQNFSSEKWQLSVGAVQNDLSSFTVFPNPVKDNMHIQLNNTTDEPLSFKLYNMEGKVVSHLQDRSTSADGRTITFPVNGLPAGIYYLKMQGKTLSGTKKVLLIN